jgi:hypothetical protein
MENASLALDTDGANHRRRLGGLLGEPACTPTGAPYVARSFIRPGEDTSDSRLALLGDQLESVRKRMKDGRDKPDGCRGVAGFTEDDWRRLDAIKPTEAASADR